MARKTFVSYKYSEAKETRDKILEALGEDARYYKGETSESPDLTDRTTEYIKRRLSDMIHGTSVTIVVISPNLTASKWIDWEIEYSLKEITRDDKVSRSNGLLGVIQKFNNSYQWIEKYISKSDGCTYRYIDEEKLYNIINKNRFNLKNPMYTCDVCKTVNSLNGSYVSMVNEEDFLKDPNKYIENAFEKSKMINNFNITKTVRTQNSGFSFW